MAYALHKTIVMKEKFNVAPRHQHRRSLSLWAIAVLILTISGCRSTTSSAPAIAVAPECTSQDGTYFTLSGTATYDWVPADSAAEGGIGLDYSGKQARPIRRAAIRAVNSSGAVLIEGKTDDSGNFSMNVPGGCGAANILVIARSKSTAYAADGIGQDQCSGANWDIRIVDNTNSKAYYAAQTARAYSSSTAQISVHAAIQYSSNAYIDRTAAPFAILDTMISEMELICQANPSQYFPLLYVNWSPSNVTISGRVDRGQIGTSYFTTDASGTSNIYILGEENVDTDEYDDHVIAHEYGHYLEFALFRADSIGGNHVSGDMLDPRVAFSEGYATAVAAMTFNDPIYVDTNNTGQKRGFSIDPSSPPFGNDRGLYSESSVQHFLWTLFENHRATVPSNGFERLYSVLKNFQVNTPGFTTLLSFSAYYNQQYGSDADGLSNLWEIVLKMPMNALCAGNCLGSGDIADPLDVDNDLGNYFTAGQGIRRYDGKSWGPDFWRLYRPLVSGVNAATHHEVTERSYYSYFQNKFGNNRWYRYVAPDAGTKVFSVSNLSPGSCSEDVLDLFIYRNGVLMNFNDDLGGCPSLSITTMAQEVYTIEVRGQSGHELSGWNMTVSP